MALPIEATVGTGSNTANILIEFQDGAAFQFEVLFDGLSITGIDAMNTLDTALGNLSLVLLDFGPFGFSVDCRFRHLDSEGARAVKRAINLISSAWIWTLVTMFTFTASAASFPGSTVVSAKCSLAPRVLVTVAER